MGVVGERGKGKGGGVCQCCCSEVSGGREMWFLPIVVSDKAKCGKEKKSCQVMTQSVRVGQLLKQK